jgi:hypothetical protein
MKRPVCCAIPALLIVAWSPLCALSQEGYRLLTYKSVSVVSLEGPSASSGGGPGGDGIIVGYSLDYAVALTEDGHLVVNGDYYGQVPMEVKTTVLIASGRVFVDGVRRSSKDFPIEVEQRFFGKPDKEWAEFNWSGLFGFPSGAKVFVRDARSFAASGNQSAAGIGPYVLGMNKQQVFSVWGIPYGEVRKGDTIEVYRDRVLVNGTVRPPTLVASQKQ